MLEVRYYLRGWEITKNISGFNEYGNGGYQWRNILAVIADCGEGYPQISHIDNLIRSAEANEDSEELSFLNDLKSNGKEWFVSLGCDSFGFYDEEQWIEGGEDEEEVAKKAVLELGYGEGAVLEIKDFLSGETIYSEGTK